MGLGDFITLVNEFGIAGLIVSGFFVGVMFVGAIVDILQFWWVMKRHKARRERQLHSKIRAQLLLELHEQQSKNSKNH